MASPQDVTRMASCHQCGAKLQNRAMGEICLRCVADVTFGVWQPTSEENPRRLGDYELLEELGRGGMGVVYKARQTKLNRVVALKMILAGRFAGDEVIQRFHAEAEAAAQLKHRHIVTIHDIGLREGYHYFSMDYIEGRSLSDIVRQGAMRPARAARLTQMIAEAIHAAHEQGIVHRDLKPSNILIDLEDEPHVTDFGLAKRLSHNAELTLSGEVLGSPNYLSPEQAAGHTDRVGPRSDVYSLGAVLYFLLVARPPIVAESVEQTLRKVVDADPIAPRVLNPLIPRDLETICLKCLAKESGERYQSAKEMADDLTRFRAGRPILARPVRRVERWWRMARRNPLVSGLSAAVAAALFLGLVGITWQWREARANAVREMAARGASEEILMRLQAKSVEDLLSKGKTAEASAFLAQMIRRNPENRALSQRLLALLSQHSFALPLLPTLRHESAVSASAICPDGQRFVTASKDGHATLWDAVSGAKIAELPHDGAVVYAAFSPDGQRIITCAGGDTPHFWNGQTGERLALSCRHTAKITIATFDPSGRFVVTLGADHSVRLWDASTGQSFGQSMTHSDAINSISFSQDGNWLSCSSHGLGEFQIWNTRGGECVWTGKQNRVRLARLSPDGTKLLSFPMHGNDATLWDVPAKKLIATLHHGASVQDLRFSPDGEMMASVGADRMARLWSARDGTALGAPLEHLTWVNSVRFSQDGLRLLTVDDSNQCYVWDLLTRTHLVEPIWHPSQVLTSTLSPEGERLLTTCEDGSAHFWDIRPGEAASLPLLADNDSRLITMKSSPDMAKLLVGLEDGKASLLEPATGKVLAGPWRSSKGVSCVEIDPHGKWAAVGANDNSLTLWSLENGKARNGPWTLPRPPQRLLASPNGDLLLVGVADGSVRAWNPDSGEIHFAEPIRHLPNEQSNDCHVQAVDISADGLLFAAGSLNGQARLWDARDGKPRSPWMQHQRGLTAVSLSRDSKFLLTGCRDGYARLWDARTGQLVHSFRHYAEVTAARWTPGDRFLVTASRDHTVRVWDPATGTAVYEPLEHGAEITALDLSGDGACLLSASRDRTGRVWDLATGTPVMEPFHCAKPLTAARLSHDGRWAAIGGAGPSAVWEVPLVRGPAPTWLADLAEAVVGLRRTERGGYDPLPRPDFGQLRQRIEQDSQDYFKSWAVWFFADRHTRSISPMARVATNLLVKQWGESSDRESWEAALRYRPAQPAVLRFLANRLAAKQGKDKAWDAAQSRSLARRALALDPENRATLESCAKVFLTLGDVAIALALVEDYLKRYPDDPRAWLELGQISLMNGQASQAEEGFGRALSLAKQAREPALEREAWRRRRTAQREAGHQAEAAAAWVAEGFGLARALDTPATCLDLSAYFNASLGDPWQSRKWMGNHLGCLPSGVQHLQGVAFDIRGIIQLFGRPLDAEEPGYPKSLPDLPIGRACRRLHFLHSAGWGGYEKLGTEVAKYILRYEDGIVSELPIRLGEELHEWHIGKSAVSELKHARRAWEGINAAGVRVQLYLMTWENPRPEKSIASLELRSTATKCAPFVLAITTE